MNFCKTIVLCAALSLCVHIPAFAGQFDATALGKSLPMWMETLADINNDGDVAWSSWTGASGPSMPASATGAQYVLDGVSSGALPAAGAASWAAGISERMPFGTDEVVGIAGSDASSQRMLDRSALLWSLEWPSNGSPDIITIDLGAVTPLESDPSQYVQQSAAYGIVARIGAANRYYVGGFARDRVARSVLPKPVIWTVTNTHSASPTIIANRLPTLGGGPGNGNGYVSSIAQNGSIYWACGNSAPSDPALYVQATCWDISAGPASASASAALYNKLKDPSGFGPNVITSMVHRVRTVPVGLGGAQHTVAVGSALVGSGTNAQWKGWVYDLTDGRLWKDLNLTGENETLAYDVASLSYLGNNNGTPVTSNGMIIGGISSTAAPATLGGLEGAPISAQVSSMTGVERRMLTSGITDAGHVCVIDDDSEAQTADYEQLLALSGDGSYRLAMAGGQLFLLNVVPDSATVAIRNRDATQRARHYVSRTPLQYYQVQATLTNPAHAAILRFGNALACQEAGAAGLTGCGTSHPAAFDIGNDLSVDLTSIHGASPSTTVRGGTASGGLFASASRVYAQLAQRHNASCTMTPVLSAVSVAVTGSSPTDFDGTAWTWCGADKWVDTQTDYDNCSGCGQVAEVSTLGVHNNRPLSECVYGQCVGGAVQIEANAGQRHKANTCFIDQTCWVPADEKPIANTGAETATNFCSTCDPITPANWSLPANATCCEPNGEPKKDAFEKGYRPNGVNVPYSGNTMTATWIPRINDITDGSGWSHDADSCTGDNWVCTTGYYGVHYLNSYLNSTADQEDWYWFRSLDNSGRGSGKQEPRVRLRPTNGANLDLCVYWRCLSDPARTGHPTWLHGGGQSLSAVLPANSPLNDGTRGLQGVCAIGTSSGPRDIEIGIESEGCGPNYWTADVFVQVKPRNTPNTSTCDDTYELQWGNDQYHYDRYFWCETGWWNSPENGKGEFACDNGQATELTQPF